MKPKSVDEAITYRQFKDRPLGFYLFTNDTKLQEDVLYRTISGGVTINNCVMHVAQHDMPSGGVGASGMGRPRLEGFLEFTKLRPVFKNPRFSLLGMLYRRTTRASRQMSTCSSDSSLRSSSEQSLVIRRGHAFAPLMKSNGPTPAVAGAPFACGSRARDGAGAASSITAARRA